MPNKIDKSQLHDSRVNIATVGSKNRVCLPPRLVEHLGIVPKEFVVWILKRDRNGVPYSYMLPVKPENFEVEGEEIVTVADTFKK